ncbi:ABC transporter ATP-binding protein [Actinopolymorpha sp. NPDC004070]|uniref:ABC transporter ATP-binding protein n=1 Tax=Actinopolymorpha sp. NPDC004070 TaxID=3154548 RepID=UPI0033B1CE5F
MRDQWRGLLLLLGVALKTDRQRVLGLVIEPLGMVAAPVVAYCLKLLVDGVAGSDGRLVLAGVSGIAVMRGLWFVGTWTGSWIRVRLMEEVGFALDKEIATLSAALPGLDHHERADFQDRLELLRQSQGRLGYSLNSLIWTAHAAVSGVVAIVVLAVVSPWVVVVALFALPAIPVAALRQRWSKPAEEVSAAPSRLARHLRGLPMDRNAGMELRVFGLTEEVVDRFRTAWLDARRPLLRVERRAALLGIAQDVLFAAALCGAVIFVLWRAGRGEATVGDVVMAVYLSQRIQRQVVAPIQAMSGVAGDLRAAGRMVWLREYAAEATRGPKDGPVPDALVGGVTFENVSFRYPGTDRWVVRDFSLHIPAGTVVAVVGENGSGKTTLVKLLSRMYEPTRGRILVDGTDLRTIDPAAWRLRLSAACQDFARLELTAQHTVGVGRLPVLDDRAAVGRALENAGASDVVATLPGGIDSQLGTTWDEGVDLSTGQWQKFALARAFMRTKPLVLVLDEPTASLDAQTEHDLFARYTAAGQARTACGAVTILVSHRFSTVRSADLIAVVDRGRLAEVGTHDQLMAWAGVYADLYTLQARSYT